ncbi:hypothetical protein WMY93_030103 [Mugilogobius chulae]|uniref:Uncharacterized protein n=1 Tax=Mugilogobius chulae TaxID=88201 RepID=A0AAW0MQX4_9GOBI
MTSWSHILPPSPTYPSGHWGKSNVHEKETQQKRGAQELRGPGWHLQRPSESPVLSLTDHRSSGILLLMPLIPPPPADMRLTWSVRWRVVAEQMGHPAETSHAQVKSAPNPLLALVTLSMLCGAFQMDF